MTNKRDFYEEKMSIFDLKYFAKENPFAYILIKSVFSDYAIIMCQLEKRKYPNSNVLANDPNLANYLEEQFQLNKLTPSGEYYQTYDQPMGLVPSFIVNGCEYLREEDKFENTEEDDDDVVENIRHYWYVVEKVEMKDICDDANNLLNHINNMLRRAYKGTEESVLTILKKEVEKLVFSLNDGSIPLEDKSNNNNIKL